jgi:hypothetical protein
MQYPGKHTTTGLHALILCLVLALPFLTHAQAPCDPKDIYAVPGQTVVKPGGQGTQWTRMELRFDPHYNNSDNPDYYVYDAGTRNMMRKKILLPKFCKAENKHRIVVTRESNHLVITDNGASLARLEDVFAPGTRYNMFTFGIHRTGSNAEATDRFYLSNVSVDYGK